MAYEELFTDLLKAEREEDVTWAGELSRDCFQRPASQRVSSLTAHLK
jgi:hypothetical protein